MNSLVFKVNACCCSIVNSCLHISPVNMSYPPMPVSQASLIEIEVGVRKTIELRDIPATAYFMNSSQSFKSSLVSVERYVVLFLFALCSSRLTLFIKCLAWGMM